MKIEIDRRVVAIGKGEGARLSMRATGIGVPPLSPLPAFPRRLGDALQRGRIKKISLSLDDLAGLDDSAYICEW